MPTATAQKPATQSAPPTTPVRHLGCITCHPDGDTFTTYCGITKQVEGFTSKEHGECVVCRELVDLHHH